MSIVIGILAAYFSNYLLLDIARNRPELVAFSYWLTWVIADEVWRGMFAVEMIPAAAFSLLLIFVPESPRWLVKVGRGAAAKGRPAAPRAVAPTAASRGDGGIGPPILCLHRAISTRPRPGAWVSATGACAAGLTLAR